MTVTVRALETGGFEVVKLVPELLGTFPEKDMAHKFAFMLMDEQKPDDQVAATVEIETSSAKQSPKEAAKAAPKKRAPSALKLPPEKTDVADASDDMLPWTEAEFDQAFSRLANGESLRDVAADFSKSWTALRGKWASFKKKYHGKPDVQPASPAPLPVATGRTETPLEMVTDVIATMKDQQVCNLCGKHFNITPDNIDTCQRCTNAS
ncbi:hypothetical protein [Planktotalea sp.]|uniref:hypothetical protein n=1 Tax=Planktotalea sp. TaxID=2029877 RepID=UPI003D6ACB31